jgi:hypothetical protein
MCDDWNATDYVLVMPDSHNFDNYDIFSKPIRVLTISYIKAIKELQQRRIYKNFVIGSSYT